jgi:hypothetical protein
MPVRPPPVVPGVRTPSWSELPNACTVPLEEARLNFSRATADANTAVHVLDVVGLETGVTAPLGGRRIQERLDALPALADLTGGRTVINTNEPERLIPAILEESSAYYLVGFSPGASAGDRRSHRIEVRVERPGVIVHARGAYRRLESPTPSVSVADSSVVEAIGHVLPAPDVPLEASVAPMLSRNGRDTVGVIVARLLDSSVPASLRNGVPTVKLLTAVFTPLGRVVMTKRRTIELQSARTPAGFPSGHGVVSLVPLEPGRYEVRLAAEIAPGTSGSVHTFVEVPDFRRDRLAMSGAIVQVTPSDPLEPRDEANALAALPTARRSFVPSDVVDIVTQFSQGTGRTDQLKTVLVTARITDARDADAHRATFSLGAEAFTRRVATQRFRLPIQNLAPGDYLLRLTAGAADVPAVTQTVRFSVHERDVAMRDKLGE